MIKHYFEQLFYLEKDFSEILNREGTTLFINTNNFIDELKLIGEKNFNPQADAFSISQSKKKKAQKPEKEGQRSLLKNAFGLQEVNSTSNEVSSEEKDEKESNKRISSQLNGIKTLRDLIARKIEYDNEMEKNKEFNSYKVTGTINNKGDRIELEYRKPLSLTRSLSNDTDEENDILDKGTVKYLLLDFLKDYDR